MYIVDVYLWVRQAVMVDGESMREAARTSSCTASRSRHCNYPGHRQRFSGSGVLPPVRHPSEAGTTEASQSDGAQHMVQRLLSSSNSLDGKIEPGKVRLHNLRTIVRQHHNIENGSGHGAMECYRNEEPPVLRFFFDLLSKAMTSVQLENGGLFTTTSPGGGRPSCLSSMKLYETSHPRK